VCKHENVMSIVLNLKSSTLLQATKAIRFEEAENEKKSKLTREKKSTHRTRRRLSRKKKKQGKKN